MFKRLVIIGVLGVLGVAMGGCSKDNKSEDVSTKASTSQFVDGLTKEQAAKVVAKVGDKSITVGDVTEHINRLSPYIKRRWAKPENRKEFLQKMIQIELLSQEAIKNGLDDSPEVQRAVKQVMVRLMVKNDLQKDLLSESISDKALQQEYERQWTKYHIPSKRRVSQIVASTEAEAVSIISQLQKSKDKRGDFRAFAREQSIDTDSKSRAGDIGYVLNPKDIEQSKGKGKEKQLEQLEGVSDEVAKAVYALEHQNDFTQTPIRSEKGYHILMITNIKPPINRSFKSVKRLIESKMLRDLKKKKMNEFIASLRKKANVKIYKENLDKVKLELTPSAIHDTDSATAVDTQTSDEKAELNEAPNATQ